MRRAFVVAVLFPLLLTPIFPVQPVRAALQSPAFQKGISFTAWWEGQYTDPVSDISLNALADTGANWISLVVTAYQDTYASTAIDYSGVHTPTDADLAHVIEQAHGMGLKVMLKPHVDLNDESNGHWRGHIGQGFTTEAQWSAWFASYRAFIVHYAALAQAYGADQFSVGVELLGTTHRAADWRAIIAAVRAVYDGPVIYAALHGGEEVSITWWDAVDFIGVDAYYPLFSDLSQHPTTEELEVAWQELKTRLANLSATYQKLIIFTEIGYRSQHGCSSHPWDSNVVSAIDMEEQANAYEAVFLQLNDQGWLVGMYWWQWLADPYQSGPCDDGYSPYQKPAEDVLRYWYGGQPRAYEVWLGDDSRTMTVYGDGLAAGWQDWSWGRVGDLAATDPTYSAPYSIVLTLSPWGALALGHEAFSTTQYHWLEFYVYGSSTQPTLQVYFEMADGTRLPAAPVNDCRHIEEGTIDAGEWKRVRIPMNNLNPDDVQVAKLVIQNKSDQTTAQFWIDDLRLVAVEAPAAWVFLPLVVQ